MIIGGRMMSKMNFCINGLGTKVIYGGTDDLAKLSTKGYRSGDVFYNVEKKGEMHMFLLFDDGINGKWIAQQ